jgi:hypothetical protein
MCVCVCVCQRPVYVLVPSILEEYHVRKKYNWKFSVLPNMYIPYAHYLVIIN